MKTKRTILSVFLTLAMVASLCVITAAPAGADVSEPTVTQDYYEAGKAAGNVTIEFRIYKDLNADQKIYVTFDDAVDVTGITKNVTRVEDEQPLSVSVDGSFVTITNSVNLTAGDKVTLKFLDGANINNPADVGDYTLEVATQEETTDVTSEAYTITGVSFDPKSGPKGETITVKGAGFTEQAGLSVDIYVDGNQTKPLGAKIGSTTLDGEGKFELDVQYDQTTNKYIAARDGNGVTKWSTDQFELESWIELDPTSGPPGTTVTVTGGEIGENVTIYFAGEALEFGADAVTTGSYTTVDGEDGVAPDDAQEIEVDVVVPGDSTSGDKLVEVRNAAGDSLADATFAVESSSIDIDPVEGPVGQTVSVEGSGLVPDKDNFYDLYFEAVAEPVKEDLGTNSEGELSTSFEVPSDATAGEEYDVYLTLAGKTDAVATATYQVIEQSLTASPVEGPGGTTVTLTGEGYPASDTFSIVFKDEAEIKYVLKNVSTTELGYFETKVDVPAPAAIGKEGEFYLAGIPGTTADFEVTAPEAQVEVDEGMKIGGIWDKLVESVWYFDNSDKSWSQYYKADPDAVPEASRLSTLTSGNVYWVNVSSDTTLRYGGETISLTAGWNIITWP